MNRRGSGGNTKQQPTDTTAINNTINNTPTSNADSWQPPTAQPTAASAAQPLDPWGIAPPTSTANQTLAPLPNMGPPPQVQVPPISSAAGMISQPLSAASTLTFDTAYNFTGPSVTHNSVLNEFFPSHPNHQVDTLLEWTVSVDASSGLFHPVRHFINIFFY